MEGRKHRHPESVSIKRTANGAHIVTHHYDNSNSGPSYQSPTEHAFSSHAKMMAHVNKHTGGAKHPNPSRPAKQSTTRPVGD